MSNWQKNYLLLHVLLNSSLLTTYYSNWSQSHITSRKLLPWTFVNKIDHVKIFRMCDFFKKACGRFIPLWEVYMCSDYVRIRDPLGSASRDQSTDQVGFLDHYLPKTLISEQIGQIKKSLRIWICLDERNRSI